MREGRSVSQLPLEPHAPNLVWRFLRHIGIFQDHLGGVDTPTGRVPVPTNWAKLSKYIGGVGRSISHLLLGPYAATIFRRFLRHIGTFLDHLGGVDTPTGKALAPKNQAKLSKYLGERGQYLSFY